MISCNIICYNSYYIQFVCQSILDPPLEWYIGHFETLSWYLADNFIDNNTNRRNFQWAQRPQTWPRLNEVVWLVLYGRSTCPILSVCRPTNRKLHVCEAHYAWVFSTLDPRETGSIAEHRIHLSRRHYIPTIAAVVDGIYFINMSFEQFLSDQLALWRVSHVVTYFFNGFVLFAFLVLLKKQATNVVYFMRVVKNLHENIIS